MSADVSSIAEFSCPGRRGPVSRAVHLARLAAGDPACRECALRGDDQGLSPGMQRKLAEAGPRWREGVRCEEECIAGLVRSTVDAASARRLAVALAMELRRRHPELATMPVAVVGGDGRAASAEVLAACSDGLRWAGCHVVEAGTVSSPCLVQAQTRLGAEGGLLVGQPPSEPRDVALKFWLERRPLSGEALEQLSKQAGQPANRPGRRYGLRRRCEADRPYLAALADRFHALRPLRFAVETTCEPVLRDLRTLLRSTACELVGGGRVHFRAAISDDGESCRIADERGRPVPPERLFLLLARHALAEQQAANPGGPGVSIVLERETPADVARALERLGAGIVTAASRRSAMAEAVERRRALLGGGASGRVWYPIVEGDLPAERRPAADALDTLARLLEVLSQSDRPLSGVLDAAAAAS